MRLSVLCYMVIPRRYICAVSLVRTMTEEKTLVLLGNLDTNRSKFLDIPVKAGADSISAAVGSRYRDVAEAIYVTLDCYGLLQAVEECMTNAQALYKDAVLEARADMERRYKNDMTLLEPSEWDELASANGASNFDAAIMDEAGAIAKMLSEKCRHPVLSGFDSVFMSFDPLAFGKGGAIELASMWIKFKTRIDCGVLDEFGSAHLLIDFIFEVETFFSDFSEPNRQGRPSIVEDERKRKCCSYAVNELLKRNNGRPTNRGWKSDLYADIAYSWNTQFKRADEADIRPDAAHKWVNAFYPDLLAD